MIAFLRSQLSNNNISISTSNVNQGNTNNVVPFQNTAPTSNCSPDFQRNILNDNNLSLRQSHLNGGTNKNKL